MQNRNHILQQDDVIRIPTKNDCHVFRIISVLGEGASVVCYEVEELEHEMGDDGFCAGSRSYLKEFYPMDEVFDKDYYRDEHNNLLKIKHSEFCERIENYLDSYRLIKNSTDSILHNYIERDDLLIPECQSIDMQTTVYIWEKEPRQGIVFQKYLTDILDNPIDHCEQKLLDILKTVNSCAHFISCLHQDHKLYLDMKPDNMILCYTRRVGSFYDINSEYISVFDLNSTQKEMDSRLIGTKGFVAPEVIRGRPQPASDIYSIGAMLFYAINVVKKDNGYEHKIYDPACDYENLDVIIERSVLIQNSDVNGSRIIRRRLLEILENTLHHNEHLRYECEELIEELALIIQDLERLLLNVQHFDREDDIIERNKRWRGINYEAVLQLLLYHKPIFTKQSGSEYINLLVIGSDDLAFKFIDLALQCQMLGKTLRVTILTKEKAETARKRYLADRPALSEFVDIETDTVASDESYGEVRFREVNMDNLTNEALAVSINSWVTGQEREEFVYAFISLENEEQNMKIGRILYQNHIVTGPINYVSFTTDNTRKTEKYLNPVMINEGRYSLVDDSDYAIMERQAFNSHLFWIDSDNVFSRQQKGNEYYKFIAADDRYNYNASLKFALSIPYKLFSIYNQNGEMTIKKLQNLYSFTGMNEKSKNRKKADIRKRLTDDVIAGLAFVEHKRWVLAYVTEGWKKPDAGVDTIDYELCILETMKECMQEDRSVWKYAANLKALGKLHACLVRSSYRSSLKDYDRLSDDKLEWLSVTQDELSHEYDPLDRLSIELYQRAVRYVQCIEGLELAEQAKELIQEKVNYKQIDIRMIRALDNIIFDENVPGRYAFIPKSKQFDRDGLEDIIRDNNTLVNDVHQYICTRLYELGWRYDEEADFQKKRLPIIKREDELTDEERRVIKNDIMYFLNLIKEHDINL